MLGLKRQHLDFCKQEAAHPLAVLAVLLLLSLGLLSAWRQWDVKALRTEVTQMQDRLAQVREQQERAKRRAEARSPEEKKIEALVVALNVEDRLQPMLLRHIEQAWSPRLAVMNVKIVGAGRSAQLELMAADMSEVFAFVARLDASGGDFRAMVMRHGIKPGDRNLATMATVRVDMR